MNFLRMLSKIRIYSRNLTGLDQAMTGSTFRRRQNNSHSGRVEPGLLNSGLCRPLTVFYFPSNKIYYTRVIEKITLHYLETERQSGWIINGILPS